MQAMAQFHSDRSAVIYLMVEMKVLNRFLVGFPNVLGQSARDPAKRLLADPPVPFHSLDRPSAAVASEAATHGLVVRNLNSPMACRSNNACQESGRHDPLDR